MKLETARTVREALRMQGCNVFIGDWIRRRVVTILATGDVSGTSASYACRDLLAFADVLDGEADR